MKETKYSKCFYYGELGAEGLLHSIFYCGDCTSYEACQQQQDIDQEFMDKAMKLVEQLWDRDEQDYPVRKITHKYVARNIRTKIYNKNKKNNKG